MPHIKERKQDTIKLRPTNEKPKIDHWGLSQEEIGVFLSLFSNCLGLRFSMSWTPEQEKTLFQYPPSSPRWYPAKSVPKITFIKPVKIRIFCFLGRVKNIAMIKIFITCGHLCQTHNLHGSRPNTYWKYTAAMSTEAEHITSERMTWFTRLKVIILNTNMLQWELLLWLQK